MKPHILIHCVPEDYSAALRSDAREGLTGQHKRLSSRWCLDGRGRRLFERLTSGGDYLLGVAERALLSRVAAEVLRVSRPHTVIHIGSIGLSRAQPLWRVLRSVIPTPTIAVCDTPHASLERTLWPLSTELPTADWYGLVCEVPTEVAAPPIDGRRLFTCLGENFGALLPSERLRLLTSIRRHSQPGDQLLLTAPLRAFDALTDLTDGQADDATEFNRNVLYVLNHLLDTDCTETAFEHSLARVGRRTEFRLRARNDIRLPLLTLGFHIELAATEEIATFGLTDLPTEVVAAELTRTGFALDDTWIGDSHELAIHLAHAL